jgi:EAL domain-containing protein (putative c-di-GMP-specific phosphodiesterase class I)
MLPDTKVADGDLRAHEVCELVREMPFDWSGQAIALTASVGVVGMGAPRQDGLGELLQAANDALAAAKAAGGDRSYVYDADDPEMARRKESVHWVMQVDEALDRGYLRLRCQPIVPVRPGGGLQPHYEVLLGVHSGAAEPLPIAEFIDAAERYNRMRAVDRWVTRTVMDWIAAHRGHMPALHGFAVNLSGQTASDASFVDFVREQFQRTGIDPAWLSFEVTETAAISNLANSAGIVQDLKSMGCRMALDDFGSGLASYSYLKELPVDWLKIDGVFVRKIASCREDLAVVKSINEIGHFLGKKTIAEYVADDEILRLVRVIGVDYAQGFGISPPMLMDELVQTIEAATG